MGLSTVFILYTGYQLYLRFVETNQLWVEFRSEEIGTDSAFQRQVSNLESSLQNREDARFIIDQIPTDLSNVIVLEGLEFAFSGTGRRIRVTQIVQTEGGPPTANIHYRGQYFNMVEGDSIAGGVISSLSKKELVFQKDEQTIIYSMEPSIE